MRKLYAWGLALAVFTMLLYLPVVGHPFINYDDPDYVTENHHVQQGLSAGTIAWALTATDAANWHPLTWMSHALDWQLYGASAGGHHFTSVLIHSASAMVLFLLLAIVTGAPGPSFVVAALFAIHPFNVESVAWVAERKNVLSTFFFFLTLGAYGWYADKPDPKRYAATAGMFVLGLATKPMLVTLPFVLLLLDYWPLQRIQGWSQPSAAFPVPQLPWPRLVIEKVPLLALSAASSLITVIAQRSGHSVETLGAVPFYVRWDNAVYSYAKYFVKVFWPINMAVIYPHPLNRLTPADVVLSALFLLAITVLAWVRRRRSPYLITAWLFFLGTLVPVIGLMQVGAQGMADRYAYIPTVGIFVMLVWGYRELALSSPPVLKNSALLAALVLLVLSTLAYRQIGFWRSSSDLWTHALSITEQNFIANDAMGNLLIKQGNMEALQYFEAAARMAPWDPVSHGAVAAAMQDRGDLRGAVREYQTALRANPDPKFQAYTYANLGVIYRLLGDRVSAQQNAQLALRADPDAVREIIQQLSDTLAARPAAPGYLRLGMLLEGAGESQQARAAYERALALDPAFTPAQQALQRMQ
jgi:Tfp pilus assembly protein PilF